MYPHCQCCLTFICCGIDDQRFTLEVLSATTMVHCFDQTWPNIGSSCGKLMVNAKNNK